MWVLSHSVITYLKPCSINELLTNRPTSFSHDDANMSAFRRTQVGSLESIVAVINLALSFTTKKFSFCLY